MERTNLKDIGEFGLIDRLAKQTKKYQQETIEGIGDDAAVIEAGEKEYTLVSTDMLLEGIHFDLAYCPLKHLGYKAVAVNVSDIAAMNGTPKQITVSIALSNRFSVEAVEELYKGIHAACENYEVDLVGGDTTSSPSGLMISVTALGKVAKDRITYRRKAQKNEVICVTGDLGGAYIGLQTMLQEKEVFLANPDMQPELEGKEYIVKRQLKPEARTDIVYEFLELDVVPTSMIDISDGLASELMHICKNSETGAVLFEENIPIHNVTYQTAIDFNISPITCALNGGEDYELLFTIKQEDYEKVKKHFDIEAIGYITDKAQGINLRTKEGNVLPVTAQGWTHF